MNKAEQLASAPSRFKRWMKRAVLRLAIHLTIVIVVIVVWGALTLRPTPQPTGQYVATHNAAALAVPESERAWLAYRRALEEAGPIEPDFRDQPGPGEEHWPEFRAWLAARRAILVKVHPFAVRARLDVVIGDARNAPPNYSAKPFDPLITPACGAPQGHLAQVRAMSRYLRRVAEGCLEEGDGAIAVAHLRACAGIAAQVGAEDGTIDQLVGFSIYSSVFGTARDAVMKHASALSDADLAALIELLEAHAGPFAIRSDGPKALALDLVEHLYEPASSSGTRLTATGVRTLLAGRHLGSDNTGHQPNLLQTVHAQRSASSRDDVLARINRVCAAWDTEIALPPWKRSAESVAALESLVEFPIADLAVAVLFLLPDTRLFTAGIALTADRDCALLLCALERHRRAHGAWPADLTPLVPEWLAALPTDPFDGQPMRYQIANGAPLIYVVGPDHIDDHGRESSDAAWYDLWDDVDGDVVLWPRR